MSERPFPTQSSGLNTPPIPRPPVSVPGSVSFPAGSSSAALGAQVGRVDRISYPKIYGYGAATFCGLMGLLCLSTVFSRAAGEDAKVAFGVIGGFLILLAVVFAALVAIQKPWTLTMHPNGITYIVGDQVTVLPWNEISEIKIFVAQAPQLNFHIRYGNRKKLVFSLQQGQDNRLIECFEMAPVNVGHWHTLTQRAD